jgi:hypothetical protein
MMARLRNIEAMIMKVLESLERLWSNAKIKLTALCWYRTARHSMYTSE